jgi:dTDP-4-amino-4,6-dideoxygalactose transaminase
MPGDQDSRLRSLTVADYIRDIEQLRPFAYAKLNHGMWDGMARVARMRTHGIQDARTFDSQTWGLPGFLETGFYDELKSLVQRIPAMRTDIRFAASLLAFPDSDRWDQFPEEPRKRVQAALDTFLSGAPAGADGVLWKRAVRDGLMVDLVRALRTRDVVLVGPARLRHFGTFAALPRFRFVEIPSRTALLERQALAARLRGDHRDEAHTVYLMQAGPLSVWLALTLADELANATFLDLGLALDLCLVPRMARVLWASFFRSEVAASITAINPAWPGDPRAFDSDLSPEERRAAWKTFSGGILPELAGIAGLPERTSGLGSFDRPELNDAGPVRYVEDKRVDWQRVHEILELSRRANHWTNFGPVSRALERALEHILKLPPERAAVACASASVGLSALAGLHAAKRGRPLRWLVSAYTFAVQRTGCFSDTLVVDCDEHGLLDLDAAARLPQGCWDGMILTNLFGALPDSGRFAAFCAERGKALILDSAQALLGPDRSARDLPAEAISFHHTKPWGVGEGGCVIVDRADVPLVHAALNFGIGGPDQLKPFAGNGKISEIACALILDRLERLPSWSHFYHGQRRRIDKLRRHAGLSVLCSGPDNAIAAGLPILAARPIAPAWFKGQPFGMGKYYPPLENGHPRAERLFSRIVNVPAHAGMAGVPTETIERVLDDLTREQEMRPGLVRRLVSRLVPQG